MYRIETRPGIGEIPERTYVVHDLADGECEWIAQLDDDLTAVAAHEMGRRIAAALNFCEGIYTELLETIGEQRAAAPGGSGWQLKRMSS